LLGQNSCVQHFAPSAGSQWNSYFQIYGWNSSTNGGGLHQIYFGNSPSGLTSGQLSLIRFFSSAGQSPYARILPTGEIVPSEHPTVLLDNSGATPTISWPTAQSFTLQHATNVTGPYFDLPSATTPYTINTGLGPRQFFRVRH
jgi:hypothetical protein